MRYEGSKTKNISFPLGGIGTGSIGLLGNGALGDFEIFNRPAKSTDFGYTHFALRAEWDGNVAVRALMGDTNESLMGRHTDRGWMGIGFGPTYYSMSGFPHFSRVCFDGEFPIARLTLTEGGIPAVARLTAFNPFIPGDEDSSSLPAAFFEWEIENVGDADMELDLALTLENPAASSKNSAFSCEGGTGIFFTDSARTAKDIGYADLAIMTDGDAVAQEYWYRGAWRDGVTTYWRELEAGALRPRSYGEPGQHDRGSLAVHLSVPKGEKRRARFIIAWSCPVQYNYWNPLRDEEGRDVTWLNYYATLFPDSRATATYALEHFGDLYEKTASFADSISKSTLPEEVRDAASANLSVLKSPTVLRLEDGSFWAWEGVQEKEGSCEGSCQHVWNYAYAMPFLFPRLERSLREGTMEHALYPDGSTDFRVAIPHGREHKRFRPCLDGQMGEVIKCYREWRLSGDDEWLEKYAPSIFSMLDYAFSEENPDKWDRDRDGVLEGRQHHTLDMELFGPSSWLQGMYLLALECGARIAERTGDAERAAEYRRIYGQGRKFTNDELFKSGYFIHRVDLGAHDVLREHGAPEYWNDEAGEIKYQIGEGCFIDQVLADFHAHLVGLPPVFDREKKLSALRSLYKNNFYTSMREVTNMWRNFAVNDESATIMCTYPEGARRPAIPIPYCEEAMTGFEYALAALLIAEGMREEGEQLVRAVRDRYDGEKRNPWCELECGSNYARSMASFALLPIYSGFTYDMPNGRIGFDPLDGEGRFPFAIADCYGTVTVDEGGMTIRVLGGELKLRALGLPAGKDAEALTKDGVTLGFSSEDGGISFPEITLSGELTVAFR